MNDPVAPARGKPSRRIVLVGAAWSVPVIVAATAAPQAAASDNDYEYVPASPGLWTYNGPGLQANITLRGTGNLAQDTPVSVTVLLSPAGPGTTASLTTIITVPKGPGQASPTTYFTFDNLTSGTVYTGIVIVEGLPEEYVLLPAEGVAAS
ncbi:MAG: hypothetical protein KIT69_03975 [Propionibacteriaceae bacterium]|nr:hypothetical protein [Propionibacteriaceae bacterium]